MAFLSTASSLLTLFLGLEWFSISLYILCAIDRELIGSLEAGLKYLIVGGFGSAMLLFGSALVYGATGRLEFHEIAQVVQQQGLSHDALLVARARADDRRAWLQGLRSAVPHVDAGRLRGRADAGHRVHVGRDQGGRARRDAARAHDRLPAGGAPLDDRDRRDRLHLARGREPGGARADARQADARLLLDLARRLHADRDRLEQRARRPRAPLLPDSRTARCRSARSPSSPRASAS